MKEKPTTFQLAQLAAQASLHSARPKDAVRRAWELWSEAEIEIAEHENRAEYLHGLFHARTGKDIPIFTDSPEDWNVRVKNYPGEQRDVERAMWTMEFPTELVKKQLFKDKTLTKEIRHQFLMGLARACIRFDMEGPLVPQRGRLSYFGGGEFLDPQKGFPIHPKNLELAKAERSRLGRERIPAREVWFVKEVERLLAEPKLYAHLVRWAVEVRQRILAESKARLVPASLRQDPDERDRDENIQFKRKFKQ